MLRTEFTLKDNGRLGMRKMKMKSEAFLMKLAFNLVKDKDLLWVKLIRSKNKCGDNTILSVNRKQGALNIWNDIKRVWLKVL